jgi:putative RNA 2'-phosphotransferase
MLSDEQISKTLSYWLRHKPDAADLVLDEAGWGPVDGVLSAFARDGKELSWENLLRVVETSDKQRFELSPDAGLIRARQGHSISVAGDWQEAAPPDALFHGTVERFLSAIMAEGLRRMARHHVHLSADVETARKVGARRGAPVILRIEAARLAATGQQFLITKNGVWLTAQVPPDFITRT